MVKVSDLRNETKNQERVYKELYKKYLNILFEKIKNVNKRKMNTMYYNVPTIAVGYPLYDPIKCTRYIMKKLLVNEFNVYTVPTQPTTLHISW